MVNRLLELVIAKNGDIFTKENKRKVCAIALGAPVIFHEFPSHEIGLCDGVYGQYAQFRHTKGIPSRANGVIIGEKTDVPLGETLYPNLYPVQFYRIKT